MRRMSEIVIDFLKRILKQENGSTLVYLALMLFVLMGFSGLAIDGSRAYMERRKMQVSADSAALAGTRSLALENDTNVTGLEVNGVANTNDADNADWDYIVKGGQQRGVEVTSSREFETSFAKLIGFPTISVDATGAAEFRPVKAITTTMIMVNCDCVDFKQVTMVKENTNRYCVKSTPQHDLNIPYGLWLPIDKGETNTAWTNPTWYYSVQSGGTMIEKSNGTAVLTFNAVNNKGNGWQVSLTLGDRKDTNPGGGAPKFSYFTTDTNDWHYYKSASGTLTGLSGRYAGAKVNISMHGPPFQLGVGGNVQQAAKLGGAMWLQVNVTNQPTIGNILNNNNSDINIELEDCNTGFTDTDEPTTTGTCEFNWADADADPASAGELISYLANPQNGKVVRVGDTVRPGPKLSNVKAISEQLSKYTDKPLTIIGVDDENGNPNDGYQVCGFAGFKFKSYNPNVFPQQMTGEFVPLVERAVEIGDDIPDYGVRDIVMVH